MISVRALAYWLVALGCAAVAAPAVSSAAPGAPSRPGSTTIQAREPLPAFAATITTLSAPMRRAMTGPVWRKGCPVSLGALRAVQVDYIDFGGAARRGTLVVHRAHAQRTVRAFQALYVARFPVRRIHPIERYGGSDDRSIEADNTSAFNCRPVTGGTRWSEHAYGRAIDLNPIENPYVTGGRTSHEASEPFLDRGNVRPGMAVRGGAAVKAFAAAGFRWGGNWTNPVDTQHFSTTGR